MQVARRGDTAVAGQPTLGGGGGEGDPIDEPQAKPPEAKAPTPKPVPKTVSGGVLNGKATSLPKPAYPAAAKAVRACWFGKRAGDSSVNPAVLYRQVP